MVELQHLQNASILIEKKKKKLPTLLKHLLCQWSSGTSAHTSCNIWKFSRNAESQGPAQTYWIRSSDIGAQQSVL